MSVLAVTGTDTGVGKTVVTAAVATLALARGATVTVVKPAQTGVTASDPGDLAEIHRLAGVSALREFARYPDPLSPAAAARIGGLAPLDLAECAERIRGLADTHRLVLVEGTGGLLVRYDPDGANLADLARWLNAPVLLVTGTGLGTLNHTALTLEALAARGLELAGLVIGAWPSTPDLAARCNIQDLETISARPLAGALPAGAGLMDAPEFLLTARAGLAPAFGGTFDPASFRDLHQPERRTQ